GGLPDRDVLQAMGDRIAHRGPDEAGLLIEEGAALVSRRLRIIDLDGGAQPIWNEDEAVAVVFNGEIYNFAELRDELHHKGHRFKTGTDTEVIVHLYEEMGSHLVDRLRGMFAIALWDRSRHIGLLARDRLGKKPLFYAQTGRRLWFASEMQGLLPALEVQPEINTAALGD